MSSCKYIPTYKFEEYLSTVDAVLAIGWEVDGTGLGSCPRY
jgi:hypothetical protein